MTVDAGNWNCALWCKRTSGSKADAFSQLNHRGFTILYSSSCLKIIESYLSNWIHWSSKNERPTPICSGKNWIRSASYTFSGLEFLSTIDVAIIYLWLHDKIIEFSKRCNFFYGNWTKSHLADQTALFLLYTCINTFDIIINWNHS